MNYLKLIVFGIFLSISNILTAQVSVNVNIGTAPMWGPAGYSDVRYYYLPDVETYYDIETSMFIYYGNGIWIRSANLPYRYRNYDLYNGYKYVMIDYRGNEPYIYYKEYKVKYAKGYRGESQKSIGVKPSKGNSSGNVRKSNNRSSGNSNANVNKSNNKSSGNSNGNTYNGGGKGNKNTKAEKGNGGGGKGKKK